MSPTKPWFTTTIHKQSICTAISDRHTLFLLMAGMPFMSHMVDITIQPLHSYGKHKPFTYQHEYAEVVAQTSTAVDHGGKYSLQSTHLSNRSHGVAAHGILPPVTFFLLPRSISNTILLPRLSGRSVLDYAASDTENRCNCRDRRLPMWLFLYLPVQSHSCSQPTPSNFSRH